MKPQLLLGILVIMLFATQVFAEPHVLKYDKEPCPVLGYDHLSQQIKCPYSDTLCGRKKMVKLSFRIGADGEVSKIRVLRSAGESLDQFAIQGITSVEWQPASIAGENVPVMFQLPIHFCRP